MRIPLWWIILLAMITITLPNGTFWEIASFFILVAVSLIAVCRWYSERRRKQKLIDFDKWSANYDKSKKVVRVQINVNALINFHAYHFRVSIFASGKPLPLQNVDSGQPMLNKVGRIYLSGEIPMSEIPKGITELEVQCTIIFDGEVKKSSGKRKVSITDINLLEPDKKDSQT